MISCESVESSPIIIIITTIIITIILLLAPSPSACSDETDCSNRCRLLLLLL
jgi:hypothetical protein